MKKKSFLERYFKPWSLTWILQRFILVIKQRRFPQISLSDLIVDYKFTREVRKNLSKSNQDNNAGSGFSPSDLPFFNYSKFEFPSIFTCKDFHESDLSALNHYFDHIYVINLERRSDRRLEMIQKLTRLHIRAEFFAAEDGITKENLLEYQDYLDKPIDPEYAHELEIKLKRKVIYSPGAWATLKTYNRLLQDADKKGFDRILCLEDDTVFSSYFEKLFTQATRLIPDQWKLIYLGASQHSWIPGEDLYYPGIESKKYGTVNYYNALNTDGAFAIGIHKSCFSFLRNEIARMNCSFDSGPLRITSRQHRDECFVVDPNIIIADVTDSDIGISRKQFEFAKTVRWNLSDYDFPFKKDLVSVIMPAYNAGKTIEMSIRSVMLQSYQELELIVVNDGSTDNTGEIAEKLSKEDHRIILINSKENIGCYPARNLGIRKSKGIFVTFQDADDISLKNRIQRQLIHHCIGNARFSVMRIIRSRLDFSEIDLMDQDNLIRKVLEKRSGNNAILHEYRDQPNIGLVTSMVNRSLFEELGLFWENRFGSDAEFAERILYNKAGIHLARKNQKLNSYLSGHDAIPGIYRRIDTVGVICPEMTDQNLTLKYKSAERDSFEMKWRSRLEGEYEYDYPSINLP
jgi:glycosyltransferase involved in cell wall biosynthesis